MARFCKNCGTELDGGSVFCDNCGARVTGSSSPEFNSLFSKYKIDMMGGEDVIRHSQIHSGCLILPAAILGFGLFLGLISFFLTIGSYRYYYFYPGWFFLSFFNIFTIIGLIWLLIRFIGYLSNDLILTNKRVFGKCGLISTTQMQSPLNKIDSVSFSNGPIGKLIGYGTVKIATTSSTFKFRFIRDGQTMYNDIFNQIEKSEDETRNKDAKAIVDAMAEKLS